MSSKIGAKKSLKRAVQNGNETKMISLKRAPELRTGSGLVCGISANEISHATWNEGQNSNAVNEGYWLCNRIFFVLLATPIVDVP